MISRHKTGRANINFYNRDNIKHMQALPDNYYDLAIADPPYFSGPEKRKFYGKEEANSKHSKTGKIQKINRIDYPITENWDIPNEEYFNELFRISKNQIIWGVNYYDYNFGSGRIIWDKVNEGNDFSDCEIAYCSFHDSVRLFTYMWNGMMQGESVKNPRKQQGNKKKNEKRIHQTQKPVILYEWTLTKYAKKGFKIYDPNGGSGSISIACWNHGYDLDLNEKEEIHFINSWQRFDIHTKQTQLF